MSTQPPDTPDDLPDEPDNQVTDPEVLEAEDSAESSPDGV
jgi:hypothetical protein